MCLLDARVVEMLAQINLTRLIHAAVRPARFLIFLMHSQDEGRHWPLQPIIIKQPHLFLCHPTHTGCTSCSLQIATVSPLDWFLSQPYDGRVERYLNKNIKTEQLILKKTILWLLQTFLNSGDFMPADKSDCNVPCHVCVTVSQGRLLLKINRTIIKTSCVYFLLHCTMLLQ